MKLKDSRKILLDKDSDGRRSGERSDMQGEYFSTNLAKLPLGKGERAGGKGG